MTRPSRDGRSMLERARELRKLGGFPAHDRSGEIVEALDHMMTVVEAALNWHRDARHAPVLRLVLEEVMHPRSATSGRPSRRLRKRRS